MFQRLVLPLMVTCLLLGLAGCASLAMNPNAGEEKSPLPNSWQLRGKLASKGLGVATFIWQQQATNSVINISAPLGTGAARISYVGGRIAVNTGDGELGHDDAVVWLHSQGLAVPFDALAQWVQGIPVAKLPYQRSAAPDSFEQAGWAVTVRKWHRIDCLRLPSRLKVEKGPAVLKLGGLQWQWEKASTDSGPRFFHIEPSAECVNG